MTFKFSKQTFDGYTVHEPISDLFIIEEFLTLDEQKTLIDFINSLTQEDWETEYRENLKSFCLLKFGTDDVAKLVQDGKFEVTENWSDKNFNLIKNGNEKIKEICFNLTKKVNSFLPNSIEIKGPGTAQRQYAGVPLKAHYDQYTDPSIQFAAIIYLNDDYIDGELFFPNKNFTIKPPIRSLVIFPGTEDFTHGVNAPGEGPIRYVLPSFISKKGFYNSGKYYVEN
jgi:hypothetical protein